MNRASRTAITTLAIIFASLVGWEARALEFTYERNEKGVLRIAAWGRIAKGDSARFIAFAKRDPTRFVEYGGNMHLSSPGGDYLEAVKFGKILRDAQITVWIDGPCASACAVVFFSATQRLVIPPKGRVGIHRVSFPKEEFAKLTPEKADLLYSQTLNEIRKHLELLEVPKQYQELMLTTPSSDIHWLTPEDLMAIPWPSWYDEYIRAKCGELRAANMTEREIERAASALECEDKTNTAARRTLIK